MGAVASTASSLDAGMEDHCKHTSYLSALVHISAELTELSLNTWTLNTPIHPKRSVQAGERGYGVCVCITCIT